MCIVKQPLATRSRNAKAIALASKAAFQSQIFQAGLQLRCETASAFHCCPSFARALIGTTSFGCARKWHKKQSWRATSPNPEREKSLNWRLDKKLIHGTNGRNRRASHRPGRLVF